MKLRQTIEIEIPDADLLETLNESLEYDESPLLTSLEGLTVEKITDIMGDYWLDEEFDYSNENKVVTIIE